MVCNLILINLLKLTHLLSSEITEIKSLAKIIHALFMTYYKICIQITQNKFTSKYSVGSDFALQ